MPLTFSIALALAAVYYAALIGYFAVGFRRVRREKRAAMEDRDEAMLFVSVVVAARDEAEGIEACLRSILANDYPAGRFEVIVVDDFSDDETAAIVRRLQRSSRHVLAGMEDDAGDEDPLRLVQMADFAETATGHKRHALARGIDHARGDLILTTDADCTVGPGWIGAMVAAFTADTGFVAGPVRYRPGRSLFGQFQALEFLALVATGAGGIGMGRPNMCNSANVAYRKNVYQQYSTDEGSTNPGDDEVLAQHLAAETSWTVRFCADPAALVETDPVLNLRAFWAQRRRWAGTGPRYPRLGLVAAILGVYVFYVLLLTGLAAVWMIPALWLVVAFAMGLKIVAETALLYPACVHFGQRRLFRYFLSEQLVQIPYVVFVGLAAALGTTRWKGRTVFR